MSSEVEPSNGCKVFEKIVEETLIDNREELTQVGDQIWHNPELKFEEHFAHDLLTSYLESHGFQVTRNYILPTAFRAEFVQSRNGFKDLPTGIVMCEYDALPVLGHACGHNLIAEVGVACGIAVKAVMEKENVVGKLIVLGTPAEESGGGKIHLLKSAAFKDVDFALMAHPSEKDFSAPGLSSSFDILVQFKGKESHAGLCPWEGINALDASVAAYNNISLLRQQLKTDAKINVAIRDCGHAINVIPKESKMEILLRTGLTSDMEELRERVKKCLIAGANATGCSVEMDTCEFKFYKHIIQNKILEQRYLSHGKKLGMSFEPNSKKGPTSDCGNVSHEVPTLHPVFHIGSSSKPHTEEFAAAAISPLAQPFAMKAAGALALTFLEFLTDPTLRRLAKVEFLASTGRQGFHV